MRITYGDRSLVYSADTGESPELVALAHGADVFLCEASVGPDDEYVPDLHLTGRQAGEHADKAGVERLIVTHVPPWGSREVAADEAAEAFHGAVEIATPAPRSGSERVSRPVARHLLRAKDLADARFLEPLGVDDLARAAGLSRAHFSREFRRAFGESPHGYLLTRRLERAAAMLRTTDRSVADICMAVGLQSVGSFTTSFRRDFGMTPTAYRAAYPPASRCARVPACVVRVYGRPPRSTARLEKTAAAPAISSVVRHRRTRNRHLAALGARPGRGPRLLHEQARHGGARRRHRARDGQLPLAHRRAGRTRTSRSC